MFSQVPTQIKREELVGVALGRDKADVVIKGGQIVSVTSGEVFRADVAIKGERIAMVGDVDHCLEHDTQVIDAHGQYLCPGLMDGHIHIESCMINVTQFARAVVPRGTTAVFLDPHEITNVLGKDGIKLMLDEARRTPLKVFAVVPACVPAANYHLETGAVDFGIDDIDEMLEWPGVVGLGELNDMWRVLDRDYRLHGEIRKALARGMPVDGNAPGYVDRQLNAYIASGIQSDHEAVTMEEATQRLRYGMWLLMREGSTERNLDDLVKVITEGKVDPRHCAFATDDKQAQDLLDEGHIDYAVRRAIQLGVPPVVAIQIASLNCAEYFKVDRELGSIAPGKIADILFVDDLSSFRVGRVMTNGRLVAQDGKLIQDLDSPAYPDRALKTFFLRRPVSREDFRVATAHGDGPVQVWVIDVIEGQIISNKATGIVRAERGELLPNLDADIIKMAVVERHGKTAPNVGRGFTRNYGIKAGALGCSVAHDTHNICVVGVDDADMALVVNRIAEMQGGMVVAKDGKILGELRLPLAGIMTPVPFEQTAEELRELHRVAREALGCKLKSPFMTLCFQTNPSIPYLKLSDKGLMDIDTKTLIPLEV